MSDPKNSLKLLLVEDDPEDAFFVKKFLKEESPNATLETVDNLSDGIAKAKAGDFDLVLLDLSLPESRGFETFHKFVEAHPRQGIIVLTGLADDDIANQAVREGAQDFLVKGQFDSKFLYKSIQFAIERQSLKLEVLSKTQELRLHSAAIESSTDGILILNTDSDNDTCPIVYSNYGFSKITGYAEEEVLNKSVLFLFAGHEDSEEVHELRQSLDDRAGYEGELVCQTKEGEPKWVQFKLVPLSGDDGQTEHVLALMVDMTRRKALERMKDEFVSTVSHELRTPIAIIQGAVENLKDGIVGELTEQQLKIIEVAHNNSKRLSRIINDLLDLTRLESGRFKITQSPVDLAAFFEKNKESFQKTVDEKIDGFQVNLGEGLSNIFTDEDHLMQILTNLLSNAARYATHKISVNVKPMEEHGKVYAHFSVSDDGQGLSEDDQEKIFNRFVQVNRPSGGGGYKGTGLGLSICHKLVELHKGRIWVESQVGKGATFNFTIPEYGGREDLIQKVQEEIQKAKVEDAERSLLVVRLKNKRSFLKARSEDDFKTVLEHISDVVNERVLRQSDSIHGLLDDDILIIANTNEAGALSMSRRLKTVLEQLIPDPLEPQIGFSTYPSDGDEVDFLIQQARSEIS